jgi:hypothetical protein
MHRRDLLKLGAVSLTSALPSALLAEPLPAPAASSQAVEQWGLFELPLEGPSTGNPFKDVALHADFTQAHRTVRVTGFYDGASIFRIRFMPDAPGPWTFRTLSSTPALNNHSGTFTCTPPTPGNHGPVTTAHQFHFQHADATPYFPFGTTTYAFLFASDANAALSLAGMQQCRFNKSRVCVLPKPLGKGPDLLPFPRTGATNDLTRFNPEYFQLVERRILELQMAGVQADCILFHPYDAWGYKAMGAEADDSYLRYAIARLSAYRNVWWAIANEYDLVKSKTTADWDRFFRIVQAEDPYSHLRSIHHSRVIYDNSKPWCTHASLQSYDFEKSAARREAWNKPIVYDEIQYEGDVDRRWGNLSAEEMTHRFYLATVRGTYASHGEVFISPESGPQTGAASWSDAGALRGESGPRIDFLHSLIAASTHTGFNENEGAYYLNATDLAGNIFYYFDYHRPARYDFPLPVTATYSASLIDPFAMTQTPISGTFTGKSRITLPSKPYHAVLFKKTGDTHAKPTESTAPKVPDNEPR